MRLIYYTFYKAYRSAIFFNCKTYVWFLYATLKIQNIHAVAIPTADRTDIVINSSKGIDSSSRVTSVESRGTFPPGREFSPFAYSNLKQNVLV